MPLILFDEATVAREDAFVHGMTEDEWREWRLVSFKVLMAATELRCQAIFNAIKETT